MKTKILGESVMYVIIQAMIQLLVLFLGPVIHTLSHSQMDLTVWTHRYQLIMMVIGWFILCIIFWLIYRLNHQRFWLQTKLNKTVSIITIVICIICGIGMNLFVNGFLWLLPLGELFPKYGQVIGNIMNRPFFMTLLLAGIMTPIMEEIFYRGILLGKLRQGFGIGVAVCIQALFFGIGHMNLVQGMYALIMGVLFGYVVIWTGSLYTSIVLHMVINSTSILWRHLMPVQLDGGQLEIVILIGAALMIIGLWLLSQTSKREGHNIYGFKS